MNIKTTLESWEAKIRFARERALARKEPIELALTAAVPELDPLAFLSCRHRIGPGSFYWEQPDKNFVVAGLGIGSQTDELSLPPSSKSEARERGSESPVTTVAGAPRFFAGFAFDPERIGTGGYASDLGRGQLIVPRYLLIVAGGRTTLRLNLSVLAETSVCHEVEQTRQDLEMFVQIAASPSIEAFPEIPDPTEVRDAPSRERWTRLVGEAVGAIRDEQLQKVVLARSVEMPSRAVVEPLIALRRLRDSYPTCTIFLMNLGEAVFLGATPELLVRLDKGIAEVSCLAGTAPRSTDVAIDDQMGHDLLASAKNLEEHRVVLQDLLQRLEPVCRSAAASHQPVLMKLPNVQHLHTPITCQVNPCETALSLAQRLHPSAAVAGLPREAALSFIREYENFDRGWYSGAVGLMDARGDGEFVVAIRSALIERETATLYAGCGIVRDSDPDEELDETDLKLRPMLSALGVCDG